MSCLGGNVVEIFVEAASLSCLKDYLAAGVLVLLQFVPRPSFVPSLIFSDSYLDIGIVL